MHPVVARVTQRIVQRSADTRGAYLAGIDAMIARKPAQDRMGCANLAHAYAALPGSDKFKVTVEKAPNIGIVTAYNDMLSAHQPYQSYPAVLRDEAAKLGATVQVAGGVPAMCDGVTQGTPGMELSLFSRDAIAMATAVALSHDVFDGALLLGVCDKIVPGLLIGALHYGHLPCVFVPAGPMGTGLSNKDKAKVREQYAQGLVGRDELLKAESAAYHSPGTCTFYGTANSNQMLLEAMGLHVPGAAFEAPGTEAREAFTRQALRTVLDIGKRGNRFTPIGKLVDERCIVNAMVALLATGGSTNHLIHWVAVARAAGITIDWNDFSELSGVVPLLAQLNLGATAIGTGICADLRFRKSAIKHLAQITGLPVTAAPDPVAAMTDMGAYVATSAAIKSLAVHLKKAADDLRLLNSGPRCGFNDLNVPARQAGSSIMPAKVNPVIPECVNQCCFTIFGMDVTVNWAVAEGQLQLNAFDPVMVHELLTGMALLTHAMETFRVNCVEGIEINADLGRSYAQSSPSISAALNHYIGYEHAADIAAEAVHTGRTVREVAGERTDLPAEQLDEILDPIRLARGLGQTCRERQE